MHIWRGALKDRSRRICGQATCGDLSIHTSCFTLKSTPWQSSVIVSTWWWRLLLMRPALNAGTVQTTPKCMGQWEEHVQDRGCCRIPQSEFPSNPHKPSPTPHGLQPPSLVWPEANLNLPHARTNKGCVPALPLWQNVPSRGDTDHKKWPLYYQRSTRDSAKQEGNGRTLWPQRERTYRSPDQQSRHQRKAAGRAVLSTSHPIQQSKFAAEGAQRLSCPEPRPPCSDTAHWLA